MQPGLLSVYSFTRKMAKASSSSKAAHSRKPYSQNGASATGDSSSTGQISISKLKSNLRQATRLLAKDKLDAQLRVETERRVESLKRELAEAEASRPAETVVATTQKPAGDQSQSVKSSDKGKGKGKGKKEDDSSSSAKGDRYKMLRHFEYQKTGRRCKKCRKEIQSIEEQLEAAQSTSDNDKAKKKQKKLRKELERLKLELQMARIDAWYIEVRPKPPRYVCLNGILTLHRQTFPKNLKYVSLYPPDGYVAFDLSSLPSAPAEPESEAISKMPSSKKVDEVRSYWRSIVKGKLEREELQGEPNKKKVEKKKAKVEDEATVDGKAAEQSSEAEGEASGDEQEDEPMAEVDLDEDDKDDFFA